MVQPNQRKNRKKKKEISPKDWRNQFQNLREQYGFTERKERT